MNVIVTSQYLIKNHQLLLNVPIREITPSNILVANLAESVHLSVGGKIWMTNFLLKCEISVIYEIKMFALTLQVTGLLIPPSIKKLNKFNQTIKVLESSLLQILKRMNKICKILTKSSVTIAVLKIHNEKSE